MPQLANWGAGGYDEELTGAALRVDAGRIAASWNAHHLCRDVAADHRELEAHWQPVRVALERVVAEGGVSLAASDVEALIGSYERHIEREERDLLPMAARMLSDDDLAHIGRAMRERRGIDSVG